MTLVRKFLFENDFDSGARSAAGAPRAGKAKPEATHADRSGAPGAKRPIAISEADLAAAVEAARLEGEKAGIAKGRAEANAASERQIAQAFAALHAGFAALAKSGEQFGQAARHSLDMALAIARKLHPALAARNGLAEIDATLGECLDGLKKEPRLVAYVAPGNVDPMRQRIEQLSARSGFEGRIVLIGDEALGPADCRVEWADGGVERSAQSIWREIEAALDRYLNVSAKDSSDTGDEHGR